MSISLHIYIYIYVHITMQKLEFHLWPNNNNIYSKKKTNQDYVENISPPTENKYKKEYG